MKIEWIEDFLTLIETGTFSQAAELRHMTQPAFSRRIRQLEDWLGVELVDRNSPRFSLTTHAKTYEPSMREWLADLYAIRARIRMDFTHGPRTILTTQHTLTISVLPKLLRHFREYAPTAHIQIRSSDRNDCIQSFERGESDILLCNESINNQLFFNRPEIERLVLGTEKLIPVCAVNNIGRPLFKIDGRTPIPLIAYDSDSFLGSVLASPYLLNLQRDFNVEMVCESSFTIGMRELTLAGLGISWLPSGLIERDIIYGNLVSLEDELGSPDLIVSCYKNSKTTTLSTCQIWTLLQKNHLQSLE